MAQEVPAPLPALQVEVLALRHQDLALGHGHRIAPPGLQAGRRDDVMSDSGVITLITITLPPLTDPARIREATEFARKYVISTGQLGVRHTLTRVDDEGNTVIKGRCIPRSAKVCVCGAMEYEGCFCELTMSEFLRSKKEGSWR